ncbi:GNAT family N-acetyltransferase [Demequina subtropica]|uniref:GNAT family N-acetyltransferase n=1 Tax=Demequina subtropica TaxID=1638989 RepID=UPI00078490B9|nr:GNAT family N-acetyltransferase [Demequina subtropica]
MITIRRVEPDDADAHLLWSEQQADLAVRYDSPDLILESSFPTLVASLVGYAEDGEPVASIVLRWSPYPTGAGSIEVKRLWVRPAHRGHGHSKVMMGAAESIARKAGATRIVLETGTEQPEALGLYDRLGYERIAPYGEYKDEPDSVCYGLDLAPRVLIVTGTLGAGKTAVGGAIHELLAERGARTAFLDADALIQSYPAAPHDPGNEALLLRSLALLAPLHRDRGVGNIVLACAVETAEALAALARALGGGTAPDVAVVRVAAPLEARLVRFDRRPVSERWLDWARERTIELDALLDAAGLEDATVDTGDRDPFDVAAEALDAVGW